MEIKQREERILDVAARVLLEEGYQGLNMEEIAREIGYSKGTVYGHFCNKEDILMELASRGVEKRAELFSKAAAFPGQPRERMAALAITVEWFVETFPQDFAAEIILRTETLQNKAAPERQYFLHACESRCLQIMAGLVRDGMAAGQLELTTGTSPEEIAFSLWSFFYGAHALLRTGTNLQSLGIKAPVKSIFQNTSLMLDGFGWKPFSDDIDDVQLRKRVDELVLSQQTHQADSVTS